MDAGRLGEHKESGFRQESEAESRPHRAQEERHREDVRLKSVAACSGSFTGLGEEL